MSFTYITQTSGWTLIDTDDAFGKYADTPNLLVVIHCSTTLPSNLYAVVYLEDGSVHEVRGEVLVPTLNDTFVLGNIGVHEKIRRILFKSGSTVYLRAIDSNDLTYEKNMSGWGYCLGYWSPARANGVTSPANGKACYGLRDLSGWELTAGSHSDQRPVIDTDAFGDGTTALRFDLVNGQETAHVIDIYDWNWTSHSRVLTPLTDFSVYCRAKWSEISASRQGVIFVGGYGVVLSPEGIPGIETSDSVGEIWGTTPIDVTKAHTFSLIKEDNVITLRIHRYGIDGELDWYQEEISGTLIENAVPDYNYFSIGNMGAAQVGPYTAWYGDVALFSVAHTDGSPFWFGSWNNYTYDIEGQVKPAIYYDPYESFTGDVSVLDDGSTLSVSHMEKINEVVIGFTFNNLGVIVQAFQGNTPSGVNGWTLPLGFSVVSGELPPGVVLEPGNDTNGVYNHGNLSGTVTAAGTYTARIKADPNPGTSFGYYTYWSYLPVYTDLTIVVGVGTDQPPAPPWPDEQGVAPKAIPPPPQYPGPGPEYPPPPGTDSHYPDLYYQYISMNQLVNYAIPFLPTLTDMIGPYRFAVVSGTFPQGLKFNVYTGGIYGRPKTVGEYSFRVKCATGRGPVYSDVFISVWGAGDPPPGYPNMSYDILLLAVDTQYDDPFLPTLTDLTAPRTFSITAGTLPSGMVFNTSTGGVSGKPIVAGDFSITVQCVAANDTVTCELSITTVFGGGVTPGIDDPWFEYLESGYAPQEGNITGISPVMHNVSGAQVFSIRAPSTRVDGDNFVVNVSNGLFSGYSSVVLDQTYTIMCRTFSTDGHAVTIYAEVSVIVINNQDPPPRIKSITYDSPSFEVDVLVDPDTFFPLISDDLLGPFNFRVSTGALPTGLTLHSTTGMIDGTPTVVGDYDLVIKVLTPTDLVFSNNFAINVHSPEDPPVYNGVLVYDDISLLRGAFLDYHTNTKLLPAQIKFIDAPYTFSVTDGDLPEGIEFATDTGIFSGTPTTNGTSTITVEVTGLDGLRAGCTFKIIVYDTYVEPPHIPGGPEDTYWDEYAVDNVVDGDWATAPVLDIRPLTRVYLSYDAPVLAYGKPRNTRVIASSTDSGEIGTPTSADYGETDLLDVSDTNAPMWEWSANDLLDPYADNTADPTIFTTPPVAVSSWPTTDALGPEWIASGTNRPHASYFVSTSDMSQRVKRVLNFNTSDGAEHMTLDMGQDYNAMSVFIVAYVNNMGQSVHNIFDAGHVDPNDEVPCRASIAAYPDKLVVGTLPVDNMMQAGEKIVISQEYSHGWYQTKPVVFFATFADLVSSAGYYVPGKMSYRQSKLTSDTFRYLTLGRMYNSNSTITNAEMTVYGVFIVPDYLSKVSITKVCTNISSKYRLEEEWST